MNQEQMYKRGVMDTDKPGQKLHYSPEALNRMTKEGFIDFMKKHLNPEETFEESFFVRNEAGEIDLAKSEGITGVLGEMWEEVTKGQIFSNDKVGKKSYIGKLKSRKVNLKDGASEHAVFQEMSNGQALAGAMDGHYRRNARRQ